MQDRPTSATPKRGRRPAPWWQTSSTHLVGPGQRKFPPAIKNFWARAKETHRVIPSAHDREAIGNFAIAAAKLDGDRTIRAFYRCVGIDGIGAVVVRFNITFTVVNGERPETVDR